MFWKEFGVLNSFTWESSQYAYTLGNDLMLFTQNDYVKMAADFLKAFFDYKQLSQHMLNDLKKYSVKETENEMEKDDDDDKGESIEERDSESNKVKICLQIPTFGSIEEEEPNDENLDFEYEESWRDFFSHEELEDITANFKEITAQKNNLIEECVKEDQYKRSKRGDEREEMKIVKLLKSIQFTEPKDPLHEQRRLDDAPASKTPNPKLYYKYKDFVRIGSIRKDSDLYDSLNSRIVRIMPSRIQRSLPDKLHNHFLRSKHNSNYDKGFPSYEKPLLGTTYAPNEITKKPRLESEVRETSPLVPCKANHELKITQRHFNCGVSRLPSFTGQEKGQRKSNLLKLCMVSALEKMKAYQVQCRRSIRKYRPSTELMKEQQKKVEQGVLFTNSMIREHIN